MNTENRLLLCQARGPLNDLNDKLAGDDGHLWLRYLQKMLRKENPWGVYGWRPWKTIVVGDKTKTELAKAIAPINNRWIKVNNYPENNEWRQVTFEAIEMHPVKERIDLFHVSCADLGFEYTADGVSPEQIRARIVEVGYDLCPQETGYQLLLDYNVVSGKDVWTNVMSKPIDIWHCPVIIQFGNNSSTKAAYAGPINLPPSARYGPDYEFIVCRFRR